MSATDSFRLGVLVSGRGSNLEAILNKSREGYFARLQVACVVSNRPSVRALDIAAEHGVPGFTVLPRDYPRLDSYESEVERVFNDHGVNLIALAGYMKIVGPHLLKRYMERIVNIHPALLPSFPGLHGQRQAVEYGVKLSGCTVHFIDAGVDTGPIIAQRAVPVFDYDTEDSLSDRILVQEHQLYSESLKRITEEKWEIHGRIVRFL